MSHPPPQGVVMQMMMAAWTAQTIFAVTHLGVADVLQKHGALTARALVEAHGIGARPDLLERALRACASVGIFTESVDGRFGPTPLSEVLTTDSPVSVRRFVELIGGRWWPLFGTMPDVLREGQPKPRPWRTDDEAHTRAFAEAMKSQVESVRAVVALLKRYPRLRATVLDLPPVIALAEQYAATETQEIRERLTLVAGDMFLDVPPGDTYVLKTIIHDWDDASCVRLLRNCRAKLPHGGRIVCVDKVLPPMGDTSASSGKLLDMLMMVSLPDPARVSSRDEACAEPTAVAQ